MKLTRRRLFLAAAGAALVVPPIGLAGVAWLSKPKSRIEAIRAVLEQEIGPILISDADFEMFCRDFAEAEPDRAQIFDLLHENLLLSALVLQPGHTLYPEAAIHPAVKNTVEHIVRMFLLSTDMLHDGRDPKAPVTYIAYADPYWAPCSNTLANLELEE